MNKIRGKMKHDKKTWFRGIKYVKRILSHSGEIISWKIKRLERTYRRI